MRLTRRVGSEDSIRKVWSDDKSQCYGIVGTVEDLTKSGILTFCDYPDETWVYLPLSQQGQEITLLEAKFGATREEVLR